MPPHVLSGSSMHASRSMFQLSRPDLSAKSEGGPGTRSGRAPSSTRKRVEKPTSTPAAEPLSAVTLPPPSARAEDVTLAEQHYRAGVLREIIDLMREHTLTVQDIARALSRGIPTPG